ncbi:hypothetical protein VSX61_02090 [Brenneria populi subsp. brevivirga]|uniref:hypothetical protein n=1 Tax=Brenneria populi TaxID=1505588 RepID=UPI002E1881BE|nr:hypothetical protein [Brenneria populi subsp. brevivirga]
MCEHDFGKEFDNGVAALTKLSSEWFRAHQGIEISLRFSLYVAESHTGSLKQYYTRILDGSMECLVGVLPVLANRLTTEVSSVVQVPLYKLRPLLSMIIYWLIQYHAGKSNELPDRVEMMDIINGILTNRIMSFSNV